MAALRRRHQPAHDTLIVRPAGLSFLSLRIYERVPGDMSSEYEGCELARESLNQGFAEVGWARVLDCVGAVEK